VRSPNPAAEDLAGDSDRRGACECRGGGELELETALHSQGIDGQLRALEGRLAANEEAVISLVSVLSVQRSSLFEAPATSAEAQPLLLARDKSR